MIPQSVHQGIDLEEGNRDHQLLRAAEQLFEKIEPSIDLTGLDVDVGENVLDVWSVKGIDAGRNSARYGDLIKSLQIERPKVSAREMIGRACEVLKIDRECLASPSRERKAVRAREVVALVGFERYSIRLKDIASDLQKSQDTASRWLSRAAKRRREDEEFAKLVEILDRSLAMGSDASALLGIEENGGFIK